MTVTMLLVGTRKGCFVLESDADRRDWNDARALLRGLARLPRGPRPGLGLDLRRRGQRVAWRRRLAQRRSRRDVGALERGPRLRRRQRAQALEGLGPDRRARPPARRRRGLRRVREPRRRPGRGRCSARSTASPAATPGTIPANQPPGHLGLPGLLPHPARAGPLLGRDPGLRHLRDDRRRRLVDAAQPRAARRLAAREPRGRLLRAQARHVAHATPTACTSRTTSACTAATTPGSPGSRSPTGSRPSSASPPPRIRTTATAST